MSTKVELKDVCVSFPLPGRTLEVLAGINLQVQEGEFVCILGPSGCGKSTLLHAIAGFRKPSSGEIRIDGQPVVAPNQRRVLVFQERGVFPWLTVNGNIGFGLRGVPRDEKEARIRHYVELVGLGGFEHAYPEELSGGMKQRVEVARALAAGADVLFLDEPFGALDSITRMQMRSELLRIWQAEKKTVLFVTHDIDESVQLADRVVVLASRPARVLKQVVVDIPRPRDLGAPRYLQLRNSLLEDVGLAHQV